MILVAAKVATALYVVTVVALIPYLTVSESRKARAIRRALRLR